MPRLAVVGRLWLLFILYLVQGLPFGFQTKTLPVFLRAQGISLTSISFIGVLSLPWLLKLTWAPFVDTYYWKSFGKRRSWIVPLLVIMILGSLYLATVHDNVAYLLLGVFVMNLAASIQDVAVDALAIDILKDDELGFGNSAQVVGFKVGVLLGGGILTWISDYLGLGWSGVFLGMGLVIALSLVFILMYPENVSAPMEAPDFVPDYATNSHDRKRSMLDRIRDSFSDLVSASSGRRHTLLIALIFTYKSGEVMSDVMFKPFLVDLGILQSTIGLWTGVYAMFFSILGSLFGGVMPKFMPLSLSVLLIGILRLLPQMGRTWLAMISSASDSSILFVVCSEAFVGGILTTLVFSLMMSMVRLDSLLFLTMGSSGRQGNRCHALHSARNS